jgi:hypothetical protein
MSDRPADYDPRFCAIHEGTLDDIVTRVQKMVDEYHGNSLSLSELRGQLNALTDRVPRDLPQQLTSLSVRHDGLHKDFTMLRGQVYALVGTIIMTAVGVIVTWIMKGGLR